MVVIIKLLKMPTNSLMPYINSPLLFKRGKKIKYLNDAIPLHWDLEVAISGFDDPANES